MRPATPYCDGSSTAADTSARYFTATATSRIPSPNTQVTAAADSTALSNAPPNAAQPPTVSNTIALAVDNKNSRRVGSVQTGKAAF